MYSSGISLTFSSVTSSGTTRMNVTQTGPSPASGFELATETPTYYDVKTAANYTGVIQLAIPYNSTGLSQDEQNNLRLLHWNETLQQWTDITTRVDTVNHVIYGETTSLSPFAVMLPPVTVTNTALSKPYRPLYKWMPRARSRALIEDFISNITVTVTNHGSSTETFNVTIYERWEGRDTSWVVTFTDVTLRAGSSATFTTSVDGGMYGCDLSVKVSFTHGGITLSSGTVTAGTVSAVQLALPRGCPGYIIE
jgi:hypothetical protein